MFKLVANSTIQLTETDEVTGQKSCNESYGYNFKTLI
jgi:hypothetical protein